MIGLRLIWAGVVLLSLRQGSGSRPPRHRRSLNRSKVKLLLLFGLAGCSSTPHLMPTPNLYARGGSDPFADVPPALQSNAVDVLYLTDRLRENDSPEDPHYGYGRSRSVAFGVATVRFGKDVSWERLVEECRSSRRSADL